MMDWNWQRHLANDIGVPEAELMTAFSMTEALEPCAPQPKSECAAPAVRCAEACACDC